MARLNWIKGARDGTLTAPVGREGYGEMRRLAVLVAALGLFALAVPAFAQSGTITIELDGVLTGFNEGDVEPLVSEPVDPALVGATCDGVLTTDNNGSVHPGNTLIITTGGETVEIPNVEDEPGQTLEFPGEGVVVGETIDISIRFGRNGITSGGLTLILDCVQPQQTTTTSAETTTTTPGGGVETGAGGTAGPTESAVPFLFGTIALAAVAVGLYSWKGRSES